MDGALPIVRLRAVDLGAGRDSLEGNREQVDLGALSQLRQARLAQNLPPRPVRATSQGVVF